LHQDIFRMDSVGIPKQIFYSNDYFFRSASIFICFRRRLLVKPALPTCESCSSQLTWTQSLRAQRFFYEYTYCPHCREKQFIHTHKMHLSLILLAAVSPLIINLFFDLPIAGFFVLYSAIITLGFVVTPFAYSLKSKDPNLPIKS
jgi:CXXC-20-CXXC protein